MPRRRTGLPYRCPEDHSRIDAARESRRRASARSRFRAHYRCAVADTRGYLSAMDRNRARDGAETGRAQAHRVLELAGPAPLTPMRARPTDDRLVRRAA